MLKKIKSKLKLENKNKNLVGFGLFGVVFAIVGVVLLFQAFAAGNRLYVDPVTSNVDIGSDVTVALRLQLEDTVNAVDVTLNYDETKLQFKSIDDSASDIPNGFIAEGGNGTVNIVRGVIGGNVTGDLEVAKVVFTAIDAGVANLITSGSFADAGVNLDVSNEYGSVNITDPLLVNDNATFTIESTVTNPQPNTEFGLRVYVTTFSNRMMQGGQVSVNLPTGLTYQGTLDTTGTAFNPATTVTGTSSQLVNLVFVTQSQTLTGKQLIATIPVVADSEGTYTVTFSNTELADIDSINIANITADPFTIDVVNPILPAPIVSRLGEGTEIGAIENVTQYNQAFTIENLDVDSTYQVSLDGASIPLSGNQFSIPETRRNGDLNLSVTATKGAASGGVSYVIRLRSPNIDRVACVNLQDLLAVNGGYGTSSTEFDLNYDDTVGLIDLLTVTGNWGGTCI